MAHSERTNKKNGPPTAESRYYLSGRNIDEHTLAQWLGLIRTLRGGKPQPLAVESLYQQADALLGEDCSCSRYAKLLAPVGLLRNLLQVAIKIPLTLPIAAISYEFLRITSRFYSFTVCRWLAQPGLLLQRLTTEEPDDAQIMVAITSLQAAFQTQGEFNETDFGFEGEAYQTGVIIGAPSP